MQLSRVIFSSNVVKIVTEMYKMMMISVGWTSSGWKKKRQVPDTGLVDSHSHLLVPPLKVSAPLPQGLCILILFAYKSKMSCIGLHIVVPWISFCFVFVFAYFLIMSVFCFWFLWSCLFLVVCNRGLFILFAWAMYWATPFKIHTLPVEDLGGGSEYVI